MDATNSIHTFGERKIDPGAAPFPANTLLVVAMLVLPEIIFFLANWFTSPKYLLLGSSLAAGLCAAVALRWLQRQRQRELGMWDRSGKRLARGLIALCLMLPLAAAVIHFGEVLTEDGPRNIGGWLLQRISPHSDSIAARQLVACLERRNPGRNVVVKTSSWVFEETFAYEAALRGLHNRLVPTSAAVVDKAGIPVTYFSLNAYLLPGEPPVSVFVTSDLAIYEYAELFPDSVFAEAAGPGFVYSEDLDCDSP